MPELPKKPDETCLESKKPWLVEPLLDKFLLPPTTTSGDLESQQLVPGRLIHHRPIQPLPVSLPCAMRAGHLALMTPETQRHRRRLRPTKITLCIVSWSCDPFHTSIARRLQIWVRLWVYRSTVLEVNLIFIRHTIVGQVPLQPPRSYGLPHTLSVPLGDGRQVKLCGTMAWEGRSELIHLDYPCLSCRNKSPSRHSG